MLSVTLDHAGNNRGANYLTPYGTIALEVTRVTDEDVCKGYALGASRSSDKSQVRSRRHAGRFSLPRPLRESGPIDSGYSR